MKGNLELLTLCPAPLIGTTGVCHYTQQWCFQRFLTQGSEEEQGSIVLCSSTVRALSSNPWQPRKKLDLGMCLSDPTSGAEMGILGAG